MRLGVSRSALTVMAWLGPAIHAFVPRERGKAWVAAPSAAMTVMQAHLPQGPA
jgi:hypothetical protein